MATATMTNSKPILFSAPMIRALMAGTKTMTRRAVKPQPAPGQSVWPCGWTATGWALGEDPACVKPAGCFCRPVRCPYGAEGDRLWVKETFATGPRNHGWGNPIYRATFGAAMKPVCEGFTPWKPSIFMPRALSRLTLEIESVRVERLNAISEEDCWAEGIDEVDGMFGRDELIDMTNRLGCCIEDARPTYACLWESINGPGSWQANPWVWAIGFRRLP